MKHRQFVKGLKKVLSVIVRGIVLLGIALCGFFGGFVLVAGESVLGLLFVGMSVAGGIGLFRRRKPWVVVDIAILFLLVTATILPSSSCVADRRRRQMYDKFLWEDVERYELDAVDFAASSTLLDAITFFEGKVPSIGINEKPLGIVVEARDEAYKTRSIPAFSARNISLYEAIQRVAEPAGFEIEIHDEKVVLKEKDAQP